MCIRKIDSISVIIPAYNESESITELLYLITKNLEKKVKHYEIIYIIDGSTDNSFELLSKLQKDNYKKSLKIVKHKKNFGKTQALISGFENSNYDYLIMLDADLQDNPKFIQDFINAFENNYIDLVVGSRTNKYKNNILKLISSAIMNKITKLISGYSISDMNCGFKMISKECFKSLNLKSDYHRYIPFIAYSNGFEIMEIPIKQYNRIYGNSKYGNTGIKRFISSILDIVSITFITKFKHSPFNLFGKLGFVITSIGIFILLYLTIGWFNGNYIQGRPLFFLGILFVIIGFNTFILGLLGLLITENNNYENKNNHKYITYN